MTPRLLIHVAPADIQVRLRGEVHRLIAPRDQKYQSNFVEVSRASSFSPVLHSTRSAGSDENAELLVGSR